VLLAAAYGLTAAGGIILITAAGGALGRVLQTTPIGDHRGATLGDLRLGALNILPFVIAAALKTALGSSTVAIITTAATLVSHATTPLSGRSASSPG
jgi:gluconate:H+ symporter, GntP family